MKTAAKLALFVSMLAMTTPMFHAATQSASITPLAVLPDPPVVHIQRSTRYFYATTMDAIEAFAFAEPTFVRWRLFLNSTTCSASSPASGNNGSASSSSGASFVRTLSVLSDERVLFCCASNLMLLDAATGDVLHSYEFEGGNVMGQFIAADASTVAVVLSPSSEVVVFDVDKLHVLWSRPGNPVVPPMVCGTNGTLVVVEFTADFASHVQGFHATTGAVVWNVSVAMWASPIVVSLPLCSSAMFASYGPDFASVRTVFFRHGTYWQFVPPYVIQFIYPTDDGLLVLASTTTVTVLDVKNQTVLWSRRITSNLNYGRVSFDGAYLMLQGDMSTPTIVVEIRTGTHVGTCGHIQCADPCVVGVPIEGVVVLANCTSHGALLRVLDNVTYTPLYEGYSLSAADSINTSTLGPIGGNLIAAVDHRLRILQVMRRTDDASDSNDTMDTPAPPPIAAVVGTTLGVAVVLAVVAVVVRLRLLRTASVAAPLSDISMLRVALSVNCNGELSPS